MMAEIFTEETPSQVIQTSDARTAWRVLQQVIPHLLLLKRKVVFYRIS